MVEQTKIDIDQAKTWAQEITLQRLYGESVKSAIALKSIATETKLTDEDLKILGASVRQQTNQSTRDNVQNRSLTKDWMGKLNQSSLGLGKGLYSITSEIKNSLSSANPASFLGGLEAGFGKLGRAAYGAETVFSKLSIDTTLVIGAFTMLYEKAFDLVHTFENSYASGVVFSGGLEQMNDLVGESGLSLRDFTNIVDKHSQSFAALGAVGVQNVMRSFKGLTRDGASLMMTLQDATEGIMEYMDIQRESGMLTRMSDQDVAKGASEFYKNVNSIIELTGKSREEIAKTTKSVLEKPDVEQYLRTLSDDIRKNFNDKTLPALSAFGPEIADKMSSSFAAIGTMGTAGLYAFDENLAQMVQALPGVSGAFNQAIQSFKTGENVTDNMLKLDDALRNNRKEILLQARAGNQWALSALNMLHQLDAARNTIEKQRDELLKQDKEYQKEHHLATVEEATAIRVAAEKAEKERVSNAQQAQSRLSDAMANLNKKFSNLVVDLIDPVLIPTLTTLAKVLEDLTPTIETGLSWLGTAVQGVALDLDNFSSWFGNIISTFTPLFTKLGDAIKYVASWFGKPEPSTGPNDKTHKQSDSRFGAHVLEVAMGAIFLKKFMGINITKIITTPFTWLLKSLAFSIGKMLIPNKLFSSLKMSGMMSGLKLPGMPNSLNLGKMPGIGALESLEGTAKGLIRGGPGSGIKGFMTNIAEGFAAFGNAKTALGIAVITASGLGVAAVLGATALAIKQFKDVQPEEMEKAGVVLAGLGVTIAGISVAVEMFGPALAEAGTAVAVAGVEFGIGLGAIGLALIPLGGALRLATPALEAFGDIVGKVFSGMSGIVDSVGKSISGIVDSFTKLQTAAISATTDQIERLSKIPGDNMLASAKGINAIKEALSDFQPGIVAGISKFFGSFFSKDPAEQLSKLANLGDGLSKTATSMSEFSKAILEFNTVKIAKDALSTVADLGNLLYTDTGRGFFSSGKITTASKILELVDSIGKLASKITDLRSAVIGPTSTPQTPDQIAGNLTPFQNATALLSDGIKNAVNGITTNITDYVPLIAHTFASQITSTIDALTTSIGQILGSVNINFPFISMGIDQSISDVVDDINTKMPLIAHTFAGQTLDTITNLEIFISQIQDTIDNNFPAISLSITQGVDALLKTMNDTFPSIDTGLNKFSLDFKESINTINSSVINESVFTQLNKLSDIGKNFQGNEQPEPIRGVMSSGDFQKKTIAFYDNQRESNASLISLLNQVSSQLDDLDDSVNDMGDNISKAVKDNTYYGR